MSLRIIMSSSLRSGTAPEPGGRCTDALLPPG